MKYRTILTLIAATLGGEKFAGTNTTGLKSLFDQGKMALLGNGGTLVVPTTTSASRLLDTVLPAIAGRIEGSAVRVPTGFTSVTAQISVWLPVVTGWRPSGPCDSARSS